MNTAGLASREAVCPRLLLDGDDDDAAGVRAGDVLVAHDLGLGWLARVDDGVRPDGVQAGSWPRRFRPAVGLVLVVLDVHVEGVLAELGGQHAEHEADEGEQAHGENDSDPAGDGDRGDGHREAEERTEDDTAQVATGDEVLERADHDQCGAEAQDEDVEDGELSVGESGRDDGHG